MLSKSTTMRSIALIFLLMMPLTGCAKGLGHVLDLTLPPRTIIACPPLDPPPEATVDALEADARVHPETGQWAVKLEKHLTKLEACGKPAS